MVVGITVVFHLLLIFSTTRFLLGITTPLWGTELTYGHRKYLMLPFALLLFVLMWLIYRKKVEGILKKYEGKKALTPQNIF